MSWPQARQNDGDPNPGRGGSCPSKLCEGAKHVFRTFTSNRECSAVPNSTRSSFCSVVAEAVRVGAAVSSNMACFTTILSYNRTPLTQHAPAHVYVPMSRRQARATRVQALGDIDVASAVASSVQAADNVTDSSVYIGLALLLASFIGTFGVAPMFKSSFKEEDTYVVLQICDTVSYLDNKFLSTVSVLWTSAIDSELYRWIDIYEELTTKMGGVRSVEPEEAARMAQKGCARPASFVSQILMEP